jgi:nucleoside-diphosphate-sugar epimerase
MKVLILGGAGMLGPHVVKALAPHYQLRVTDITPLETDVEVEFKPVDISSLDQVMSATEGMDAIINLSVLRRDRQLAFDVSTRGCYNMMRAAVEHGIRRVINTGPHFTLAGRTYEQFDYAISPDIPPQPGTNLYALTKFLGLEICRVFTENYDVNVQTYLFYNFRDAGDLEPAARVAPFAISWADAAEVFRLGLEIDLDELPSKCEVFYIFTDMPHEKFVNDKTRRILGFTTQDDLSVLWHKKEA